MQSKTPDAITPAKPTIVFAQRVQEVPNGVIKEFDESTGLYAIETAASENMEVTPAAS